MSSSLQLDEALANELAKRQIESSRDTKLRQKIRHESHELRELESKLRAACVAREQLAQMSEKHAVDCDNLVRNILEKHDQGMRLASEMQDEEQIERVRELKKQQLRSQLNKQLQEQEKVRELAFQESLSDKAMIDEVVRRIKEEDERQIEQRRQARLQTLMAIKEHQNQQLVYRRLQQEQLEREEQANKHYVSRKDDEKESALEQKRKREEIFQQLQSKLAKEVLQKEAERKEIEEVRQVLQLEEEEAKIREEEKNALAKKLHTQQLLKEDHAKQTQIRQRHMLAEKEEQLRMKRLMLLKFEQDEEQEKIDALRRKEKQLEYAAEIQLAVSEKRKALDAERLANKAELQRQVDKATEERRVVEEERQRLLEQYGKRLQGYLPKGVFRTKEELRTVLSTEKELAY